MEIERKYLVSKLPDNLSSFTHKNLIQGYLNTDPVVRVRQEGREFFLTYKSKGLLAREEFNLPLNEESFSHLIGKADGIVIEKTRYLIPLDSQSADASLTHTRHDGTIAELDVFHGNLEGLMLVEVEFDSIEQANAFIPPEWFGTDVTESGLYQNSRLSREGLPSTLEA